METGRKLGREPWCREAAPDYRPDGCLVERWGPATAAAALALAVELEGTVIFDYSGAPQSWTVPVGVTSIGVETTSAAGGRGASDVRRGAFALADRVVVASGGGGTGELANLFEGQWARVAIRAQAGIAGPAKPRNEKRNK